MNGCERPTCAAWTRRWAGNTSSARGAVSGPWLLTRAARTRRTWCGTTWSLSRRAWLPSRAASGQHTARCARAAPARNLWFTVLHSDEVTLVCTPYLTSCASRTPFGRAQMAEDAVDAAVLAGSLQPAHACSTASLPLLGAAGFVPHLGASLAAAGLQPGPGSLTTSQAAHLARAYGDRAPMVLALAAADARLAAPLDAAHPVLAAEVRAQGDALQRALESVRCTSLIWVSGG